MSILVTGASGYVGQALVARAERTGIKVIAASRNASVPFSLETAESFLLPENVQAVIHLAADTSGNTHAETEIRAANALMQSAQKAGARFVFVSSQAASENAPTVYGKTKWRIEQAVLENGGIAVRAGQVYGGQLRGLYGQCVRLVQLLPVIPAFLPAPFVQPIHVDDLAEGLLRIATQHNMPSRLFFLAGEPVTFTEFLKKIAKIRVRKKRLTVLVPRLYVAFLQRALPRNPQLVRLTSLFALPAMETAQDLESLGLSLRPLAVGMHPSGDDRRRILAGEGRMFFRYIGGRNFPQGCIRRYVRAVEALRGGEPLPDVGFPALLDDTKYKNSEFMWRLNAATLLLEATPSGAQLFLGLPGLHSRVMAVAGIGYAVACELFWRIVSACARRRCA